jgi:hypothetical protein
MRYFTAPKFSSAFHHHLIGKIDDKAEDGTVLWHNVQTNPVKVTCLILYDSFNLSQ